MTGEEVSVALFKMLNERTNVQRDLMREYDKTVYNPGVKRLMDSCPHEDSNRWQNNGLGYSWTECKWCRKTMQESSIWDDEGATP